LAYTFPIRNIPMPDPPPSLNAGRDAYLETFLHVDPFTPIAAPNGRRFKSILWRSRESYARMVEDAFQLLLNRSADAGSATHFTNLLAAGAITIDSLYAQIADSAEYGNL
jgi:hypothetical protein